MKKMTTLFKKDPNDLGRVINEVNPKNEWVFKNGIPTRKFDGTSCAVINGVLYKRFDLKKGKTLPPNSIPCQEADKITGHHPHWTPCITGDNSNKYHLEAFTGDFEDGTYELIGEKTQGNPEKITGHKLIKHGIERLSLEDDSFEYIRQYLTDNDIEGIVFHHRGWKNVQD
jgi:hypothetical protein